MSPEAVTRVKAQIDGGRVGGVREEKWETYWFLKKVEIDFKTPGFDFHLLPLFGEIVVGRI